MLVVFRLLDAALLSELANRTQAVPKTTGAAQAKPASAAQVAQFLTVDRHEGIRTCWRNLTLSPNVKSTSRLLR